MACPGFTLFIVGELQMAFASVRRLLAIDGESV
jgi:hypothetical protein